MVDAGWRLAPRGAARDARQEAQGRRRGRSRRGSVSGRGRRYRPAEVSKGCPRARTYTGPASTQDRACRALLPAPMGVPLQADSQDRARGAARQSGGEPPQGRACCTASPSPREGVPRPAAARAANALTAWGLELSSGPASLPCILTFCAGVRCCFCARLSSSCAPRPSLSRSLSPCARVCRRPFFCPLLCAATCGRCG